ncbi:TBC1 domain family member 14 [Bagarius yarrelli]|uniref:TBC1 domain family member 14 n=1 Tax=Bagarius yarrelli TaxID=175774 RepID=A0A556V9E0_BAGYA|nr:TBC1 domain family member 14 [Bagarius yarrelli]
MQRSYGVDNAASTVTVWTMHCSTVYKCGHCSEHSYSVDTAASTVTVWTLQRAQLQLQCGHCKRAQLRCGHCSEHSYGVDTAASTVTVWTLQRAQLRCGHCSEHSYSVGDTAASTVTVCAQTLQRAQLRNLPAKPAEEAQKHRQQYEEMVAQAKKRASEGFVVAGNSSECERTSVEPRYRQRAKHHTRIFTLYSKSLPLDVACRVWDVFCRDGEEFLFRTALGILRFYSDVLTHMDFIHMAQFLTRLPEQISTHTQSHTLFSCIGSVNMSCRNRTWTQVLQALQKDQEHSSPVLKH